MDVGAVPEVRLQVGILLVHDRHGQSKVLRPGEPPQRAPTNNIRQVTHERPVTLAAATMREPWMLDVLYETPSSAAFRACQGTCG